MNCTQCNQYSYKVRRCLLGHAQPKSVKQGIEIAQIMGVTYLCYKSEVTQKVVDQLLSERRALCK